MCRIQQKAPILLEIIKMLQKTLFSELGIEKRFDPGMTRVMTRFGPGSWRQTTTLDPGQNRVRTRVMTGLKPGFDPGQIRVETGLSIVWPGYDPGSDPVITLVLTRF